MSFFFFNDTATTEIYTLSLHDALPISGEGDEGCARAVGRDVHQDHRVGVDAGVGAGVEVGQLLVGEVRPAVVADQQQVQDRKSTRLNSSHANISYAVFCLKKKKTNTQE